MIISFFEKYIFGLIKKLYLCIRLEKQLDAMNKINKLIFLYSLIFLLLGVNSSRVKAQETDLYDGMTWYLNKEEAFQAAAAENKQVFLLWGRTNCYNCNLVKKYVARSEIKEMVDDNYILWFCNVNTYKANSPVVSDYLSPLIGQTVYLPAICVIDLYDTTVGYGLRTGYIREETFKAYLTQYVSNDQIVDDKNKEFIHAYVSGNTLRIESEKVNEKISVYTMSGSLVDVFTKPSASYSRNTSVYPKGVLLVNSDAGWSQKIVIR